MTNNHARLIALVSAILAAAALRLVPHPPNFTPIGAMALFSGAYLGRRGDRIRGAAGSDAAERPRARLLSGALGHVSRRRARSWSSAGWHLPRISVLRVGAAAIASSVTFFVVTQLRHVGVERNVSAHRRADSRPATSQRSRSSRTRSPATCSTRRCSSAASRLLERGCPALRAGQPQPA